MKTLSKTVKAIVIVTGFLCSVGVKGQTNDEQIPLPKQIQQWDKGTADEAGLLTHDKAFLKSLRSIADQIKLDSDLSEGERIFVHSILGDHKRVLELIEASSAPQSFFHVSSVALSRDSGDLATTIADSVAQMTGKEIYQSSYTLNWDLGLGRDYLRILFDRAKQQGSLSSKDAAWLIYNVEVYLVYEQVLPVAKTIVKREIDKRFIISTDTTITMPDGAEVAAVVIRKRGSQAKLPTAFQMTIYANEDYHITNGLHAAVNGYNVVIANTRGKRHSKSEIIPWEYEGYDANQVIDWISKQRWSDGRVVMYGGSYLGFTQWAAAKYMHPALKAIAPYAAAHPATGLPMNNNIFITPNYQWSFHVTNNKTMDDSVYSDWEHWRNLFNKQYQSGQAFRNIDSLDDKPNPWFQKWLAHPSYDSYYQNMVPYKQEYADINIPVLSVTGYFDGGQISALDFLKNHEKYHKKPNHTLLIGPYNHGTAQGKAREWEGNYQLDKVALLKDTEEITFAWFDHLLYGKAKPALLQDKINYQLMGSNQWRSAKSYQALNTKGKDYYLNFAKTKEGYYSLTDKKPENSDKLLFEVDLTDRSIEQNRSPRNAIAKELNTDHGVVFVTEAFNQPMEFSGAVTGHFSIAINKRDVDLGFNLYELKANGETFHLAHHMSRASYADDMSIRKLLVPGVKHRVPVINGRMSAKLIEKGSRIAIVLNINKNSDAQVNMGTGKDVSDETIDDGKEPLKLEWFSDTRLHLPLIPFK